MVEDSQRTSANRNIENESLKNTFVNNTNTYVDHDQTVHPELQNLNDILKARPS